MDILSKAEEWSLLYGDKLTASATTRFPTLYKGAVGGLEHVISVDNAGSYFELWRDGENWYATTGAATKQLPGLAKGAKLDEALDQFFKLTSKVSKSYKTSAVTRKARHIVSKRQQLSCPKCKGPHKDYRSAAGHLARDPKTGATVLEPHEPRKANKHYGSSPRRSVPQTHPHFGSKTKGGEKHTHPQPLTSNFKTSGRPRVKKATVYGPSTPHDKPHGGTYSLQHYESDPDTPASGTGLHIHKPHGTKTKPYSHSHPAGRVHKADSDTPHTHVNEVASGKRRSTHIRMPASSPEHTEWHKQNKAVAQVGPELKIGHKTPSDVSGGNVNPMENKGRRDPIKGQSHTAATIHGGGGQHWHQGRRGTNSYGDYTHSHVPTKHSRSGAELETPPFRRRVASTTNKMVRMTVKDLRQLVGKGKGYLHGSRMYDSSQPHGRAGSYHSHNESPRPGNSSETSSHEHRKGSHGPVPRGTRKALKKNIMGLDTPEPESAVNPHGGSEHSHHDLSYPSKSKSKFYSHSHKPLEGHGHKTTDPPGMKYFPARKRDKLTQGGRISGGVTTPEVARTGGAGQPISSSSSPHYSYTGKMKKAKKDNCTACSEVAKALAEVGKLNAIR